LVIVVFPEWGKIQRVPNRIQRLERKVHEDTVRV
jgi:hypothetical protein